MITTYRIAGNFEGENFAKFAVLWLFAKVFSTKFGGVASVGTAKGSNT